MPLAALAACGDFGSSGEPDGGAGPDASPTCPAARWSQAERPSFSLETPAAARAAGGGPIRLPRTGSRPLHGVESHAPPSPGRLLADGPTRTRMRLLLMSATGEEPSFDAARAALERVGIPYDVFVANDEDALESADLLSDGTCLYRGVILSEAFLEYLDEDLGEYTSALSPAEWENLADFELTCGAREVVWYAWASPELGLEGGAEFEEGERIEATLTAEGEAIFSYLQDGARVPIQDVWGYRAQVRDASRTTPLLTTEEGDALAVVHERADGREALVMTMDSSPYLLHAQLLEYGVLKWLTRDLHLGKRRVYMAPQIDDVFLATGMWVPGSGVDEDVTFRMSAEHAAWTADWQSLTRQNLPEGSRLVTYMAFNGDGAQPSSFPDSSLVDTLRAKKGEFGWINHTWDHLNMDNMVTEKARQEMAKNCEFADEWGLPGFACTDAVTPEISGLDNPKAVAGMLEAGVRYVVSDTSVTEEVNPENPGSNPSHNVGRRNPHDPDLYQVPRHPTNIFYNCSTPEEEVDLYNSLYADELGRELTYDEILDEEAKVALHYLLSYDADPLMFHQANLRTFDGDGGETHTLYTDWVDRVLERYTELVKLPIRSPTIRETAELMMARNAYNKCGLEAVLVEDEGGRRLELTGVSPCEVPITGLDAPGAGEVDTYAGEPTTTVSLEACETLTVPLD